MTGVLDKHVLVCHARAHPSASQVRTFDSTSMWTSRIQNSSILWGSTRDSMVSPNSPNLAKRCLWMGGTHGRHNEHSSLVLVPIFRPRSTLPNDRLADSLVHLAETSRPRLDAPASGRDRLPSNFENVNDPQRDASPADQAIETGTPIAPV